MATFLHVPGVPATVHTHSDGSPGPRDLEWPLSHADVERWVEEVPWQEARTMLENPHEYCLRRNVDPRVFELIVLHIREHGLREIFGGYEYTFYAACGYKLWTMGDSLPTTLLVNRKPLGRDGAEESKEEASAVDLSPGLFDPSSTQLRRESV